VAGVPAGHPNPKLTHYRNLSHRWIPDGHGRS
jgi:hypothetical protein